MFGLDEKFNLGIGKAFEHVINWMQESFAVFFDMIRVSIKAVLNASESALLLPPPFVLILILVVIAYLTAKRGVAIFTLLGFLLIYFMGLWELTMATLALILTAAMLALIIAIPLGIWSSKNDVLKSIIRPILDFMQTLPAFIYLIPAVIFFELGEVPGVIATLIFSLPPAVRLTDLGIRQVPSEIREAAESFGASPAQMLFKAELPVATPTIMAGVNQTIMLALSMVVIAGMIGAGGLGNEVLRGLQQMDLPAGFEAGISIVILAIFLDRVTQALGGMGKKKKRD